MTKKPPLNPKRNFHTSHFYEFEGLDVPQYVTDFFKENYKDQDDFKKLSFEISLNYDDTFDFKSKPNSPIPGKNEKVEYKFLKKHLPYLISLLADYKEVGLEDIRLFDAGNNQVHDLSRYLFDIPKKAPAPAQHETPEIAATEKQNNPLSEVLQNTSVEKQNYDEYIKGLFFNKNLTNKSFEPQIPTSTCEKYLHLPPTEVELKYFTDLWQNKANASERLTPEESSILHQKAEEIRPYIACSTSKEPAAETKAPVLQEKKPSLPISAETLLACGNPLGKKDKVAAVKKATPAAKIKDKPATTEGQKPRSLDDLIMIIPISGKNQGKF